MVFSVVVDTSEFHLSILPIMYMPGRSERETWSLFSYPPFEYFLIKWN